MRKTNKNYQPPIPLNECKKIIKKVENQFSFSFIRVNIDHYQGTLLFDSFDDLEDFVLEEKYEALLEFAEKDLKGGFSKN